MARWNQTQVSTAAQQQSGTCVFNTFNIITSHICLIVSGQQVIPCNKLLPFSPHPYRYNEGELFRVSYLYHQAGKELELIHLQRERR